VTLKNNSISIGDLVVVPVPILNKKCFNYKIGLIIDKGIEKDTFRIFVENSFLSYIPEAVESIVDIPRIALNRQHRIMSACTPRWFPSD